MATNFTKLQSNDDFEGEDIQRKSFEDELEKEEEDENLESVQELLGPQMNRLKYELERLYASKQCRYYYILFALLATVMVTWILLVGARVHQSSLFVVVEVFINVSILLDFTFKLYVTGVKRYFSSWANVFDSIIALSCVATFLVMMCTSSISLLTLEEVIEDMLFVVWCALQYLRIIMFIKHQKDVKDKAQNIDIKHFHADSFQDNDDKLFMNDLEFNFDRDNGTGLGMMKSNKGPNDKRSSSGDDVELEDLSARVRDKPRRKMSFDENNMSY